ncbi:MAG: hypothetical protein A2V67_05575 [Deltaproteobacteria bacterium RBG_13_61_14]|nr:MAG: hypothetical protein A2V67_05575 [Deltaproteobacteria bacterium RBG_13_61_14]
MPDTRRPYPRLVTVKFTSRLRFDLGRDQEHVRADSIAELLAELEHRHGDSFRHWSEHYKIFVNGSSIATLHGSNTKLADGDEVVFLLPVAGG